jgi:hypothetical protein
MIVALPAPATATVQARESRADAAVDSATILVLCMASGVCANTIIQGGEHTRVYSPKRSAPLCQLHQCLTATNNAST